MARRADITDKLTFEENPSLIIKNKELEVNSDAPTMLRVMDLMEDGNVGAKDLIGVYKMIFPEKSQKEIEGMKLSFNDLIVVVQEAVRLIMGDVDSQGEF